MAGRQEWKRLTRDKDGNWVAKVTIVEGRRVVRVHQKTFRSELSKGMDEALVEAERGLGEIA